jgi:hypothetical protein
MSVDKYKKYNSYGNAYRVNDLEITQKKLILCVHDDVFVDFCSLLEKSFLGVYPFGYIGTLPWLGQPATFKPLGKSENANLKINNMLLEQGDFALVFYCFKSDQSQIAEMSEYLKFMKINAPSAKHIVININNENKVGCEIGKQLGFDTMAYSENEKTEELIEFAKQYIDNAGKPKFHDELEREFAEWTVFSFDKVQGTNNKRILLVGDSISYGYGEMVRKSLSDFAVDCLNTSEGTSHPNIYRFLGFMLTQYQYDIIHINIGIHIHSVTNKEYEENLNKIFDYINKISLNTRIIFATTTCTSRKPNGESDDSDIVWETDFLARNQMRISWGFVNMIQLILKDILSLMKLQKKYAKIEIL